MGAPYSTSSYHDTKPAIFKLVVVIVAVALLAGLAYVIYNQNQTIGDLQNELTAAQTKATTIRPAASASSEYTSSKGVKLSVFTPKTNAVVQSPMAITGTVPGNWSFEASFPVLLKTANGTLLAQEPAQLLGDWMTDQQVPFALKLTFSTTYTGPASLILQKDNPSGLSQNDDSITIPVVIN